MFTPFREQGEVIRSFRGQSSKFKVKVQSLRFKVQSSRFVKTSDF
jgi:hypothetical protein